MSALWPALWLSLRIALVATAAVCLVGIPLAYLMARRRFFARSFLEALITVPLVLPPTVVGYLIIRFFGARGFFGKFLDRWWDYTLLFRFEGAVLAAAVVALPMLYMPAKAAFASMDRELEDIARISGASRLSLFWHVALPLARRGIASGLVLAFARALGEFGATIMVFGFQPDRLTLPLSVYVDYEQGELSRATGTVLLLALLSLSLMLLYNRTLTRRD